MTPGRIAELRAWVHDNTNIYIGTVHLDHSIVLEMLDEIERLQQAIQEHHILGEAE